MLILAGTMLAVAIHSAVLSSPAAIKVTAAHDSRPLYVQPHTEEMTVETRISQTPTANDSSTAVGTVVILAVILGRLFLIRPFSIGPTR